MTEYASYQDIDKDQFQIDIEEAKSKIGAPKQEDLDHLIKLEKWGRMATFSGFIIILILSVLETSMEIGSIVFWIMAVLSGSLIGLGNLSRWANVAHPILHGGYEKIEGIPSKYKRKGFAKGIRRYIDWLDWIKPSAWAYEHNIKHHYHLGEDEDPDNVEINTEFLRNAKIPMFLKYIFVFFFAATWKLSYYAPNTIRILKNKQNKLENTENEEKISHYGFWTENGRELWKSSILPYALVKFLLIPSLFLIIGTEAMFNVLMVMLIAELVANLHSFAVIVPNHSAEDIYRFEEPHTSQGEFYLRQIMGSVNYNTGSDLVDFGHGWLNYQIEHHIYPNLPLSQYQKLQPLIKDICKKHKIEYRQESVFKRVWMTVELMVGKTELLRIKSI